MKATDPAFSAYQPPNHIRCRSMWVEILTAEFGQVGLDILKNNKDIDIVISDFNMPFMNGLEFIEKARKIKNDIPFYIISGTLETDEIRDALQNKLIDYFFIKPLDKSQLLNEIYNYYDYQREQV